jgi:hypothetical protein
MVDAATPGGVSPRSMSITSQNETGLTGATRFGANAQIE